MFVPQKTWAQSRRNIHPRTWQELNKRNFWYDKLLKERLERGAKTTLNGGGGGRAKRSFVCKALNFCPIPLLLPLMAEYCTLYQKYPLFFFQSYIHKVSIETTREKREQRMSTTSTLFTSSSCWSYVRGRLLSKLGPLVVVAGWSLQTLGPAIVIGVGCG